MNLAVSKIVVHLEPENGFDLRYRSVEGDAVSVLGNLDIREALGFDPGNDLIHVVVAHAEALGKLRWCQIFVVVRRRTIRQLRQELVEIPLLCSRQAKIQGDSLDKPVAIRASKIVFRPGEAVHIAAQLNSGPPGYVAVDPVLSRHIADRQEDNHSAQQTHYTPTTSDHKLTPRF